MGLYRLVYKIGRMIFRDFLFKIPKKYLVVIIVFLSMFLLKSTVFGYSNYDTFPVNDVSTDLVFYEYVNSKYGRQLNSMITAPLLTSGGTFTNNYKYEITYMSSGGGHKSMFLNSNNTSTGFLVTDLYNSQFEGIRFYWAGQANNIARFTYGNSPNNQKLKLFISLYPNYEETGNLLGYYRFYVSDNLSTSGSISMGSTAFNENGTDTIAFGYSDGIYYSNIKIYQYENDNWNLMWNFYPCKYMDTSGNSVQYITGYYDSVSGNFTYYNGFNYNDNYILSEVPEELLPSNPSITNDSSTITNWSFDTLNIDGGSVTDSIEGVQSNFFLRQVYNDKVINLPINQYKSVNNSGIVSFNIPRSVLLSDSAIINGYSVTFNLDVYTNGILAPFSLGTYTFNLTQTEQDNINQDRTQQSLDNIANAQQQTTNAINNTNNFLQSNSMPSDNDISINSPTIQNSEISGLSDGFFNNYMTTFADLFNSSDSVSIDIYIPNFVTGGGTKFITINSDIVKNHIQNLPVIPGTTFTVYGLIQVIWGALFGFWFVMIITGFVNSVYSGEIMSDEGLKKLSSTYTNVTSNML